MTHTTTLSTIVLAVLTATLSAGCNSGSREGGSAFRHPRSVRVAGALQTARAEHAIAPLGSGRILVTGGETLQALASSTAEVFDARSGSGRALGSQLSEARVGHVAAAVASGDVLILGGRNASGRGLQTVERFLAAEERFEVEDARLLFPRVGAAVSVEEGRVVFASGRGQRSVEVFDLEGLTSAVVLQLPTPRIGANLTRISDDLYLLYGGVSADREAPIALWLDLGSGETTPVGPIEDLGVQGPDATALPTGGVVFASPTEPGVAWLVSGVWKGKENRGVLRLEIDVAPAFLRGQPGPATARQGSIGLAHPDGSLSVFAGTWNGYPVAASERIHPEPVALPSLNDGRESLVALALPEGEIALVGGRGADGRPSALVDVILPEGAAARDGEAAYRDATSERNAEQERLGTIADEQAQLANTKSQVADQRAELARTEAALTATQAELAQLVTALEASRAATKTAQAEAQRLTQVVAQRAEELRRAKQNANTAADALAATRLRLNAARSALASAQQQARSAGAEASRLAGQVQSAQSEASRLSSTALSLRIQLG